MGELVGLFRWSRGFRREMNICRSVGLTVGLVFVRPEAVDGLRVLNVIRRWCLVFVHDLRSPGTVGCGTNRGSALQLLDQPSLSGVRIRQVQTVECSGQTMPLAVQVENIESVALIPLEDEFLKEMKFGCSKSLRNKLNIITWCNKCGV